MIPLRPLARLATHEVTNMPPHLGDQDLWRSDIALQEAVSREGGSWAQDRLAAFGQVAGAQDTFEKADLANRHEPRLQAFDRYGMRINQVQYHPAYHDLMATAIENEVPSFAWNHPRAGGHVVHAALNYLFNQPEGGVMCSMAMLYSAIPSLRMSPHIANQWIPRLTSRSYDSRDVPVAGKSGATMGMFMTEKQGGSDVRSNSTQAVPAGEGDYLLTGHKFFCSAPMCDAFLTLAYADTGLSCFLVPRWRPDGERNTLLIQRLKDKLGNRSNASSEIELDQTWGTMVGEPGRGIPTIIEMVQSNRYYCAASSAALMRQGLVQALHHTAHRAAFGKSLNEQPLMRNVLADLAIEVEAAVALTLRIGRAMDESAADQGAAALARIGTAVAKYWICKRAPGHIAEALECHGGPGYIEESMMPRLYREAPLNSIWEGSGNIMCLDVLRAMQREGAALDAVYAELDSARGANSLLDAAVASLKTQLSDRDNLQVRARSVTELMALVLQGSLLVRDAPAYVADAFCQSRLGPQRGAAYGTLTAGADLTAILRRARNG